MTELSVVVCTYDRAHKIGRALDALAAQTARDAIEVLVVDDGSTDGTREVVARHPDVRLVAHGANRGLSAARNTGLESATADLVAFTDDDCVPAPDWAERLLATAAAHPDAMAVGGRVVALPAPGLVNSYLRAKSPFAPLELSLLSDDGFWHRLREYLARSSSAESGHGVREVASLTGANMALRRAYVEKLGGWDERFGFGGDEEELFRRALEEGMRLVYDPAPLVAHDFDSTYADLLGRSVRYGRGNARMHAKHGGLPTLYPAPVLVLAGLASVPLTGAAGLLAALALPQAVFSVWPRGAVHDRRPERLLFPYLQVAQEAASNVGWVHGRLTQRDRAEVAS